MSESDAPAENTSRMQHCRLRSHILQEARRSDGLRLLLFCEEETQKGFTTYFCVLGVDAPCVCLGYGPWFEAEGEMTDAHAALVRTPCLDHILPLSACSLAPAAVSTSCRLPGWGLGWIGDMF